MHFSPIISYNPPTVDGQSKQLYTPDLFNSVTGLFPEPIYPSTVGYHFDPTTGKLPFYEGSSLDPVGLRPSFQAYVGSVTATSAGLAYDTGEALEVDTSTYGIFVGNYTLGGTYVEFAGMPTTYNPVEGTLKIRMGISCDATNTISVSYSSNGSGFIPIPALTSLNTLNPVITSIPLTGVDPALLVVRVDFNVPSLSATANIYDIVFVTN
jgi:hypothetical protein